MITTLLTTVIGAERERVWRALTLPAELIRWDDRIAALIEPAPDYPKVGAPIRWRYRLGAVPIVLEDRPVEIEPEERLRSTMALGLFRFDATYKLVEEAGEAYRTRVSLKLATSNSIPVVGGLLDRFAVRRVAAEYSDARMRSLQKWCENQP